MMTEQEKLLRMKLVGAIVLALIFGTLLVIGVLDQPGFLGALGAFNPFG